MLSKKFHCGDLFLTELKEEDILTFEIDTADCDCPEPDKPLEEVLKYAIELGLNPYKIFEKNATKLVVYMIENDENKTSAFPNDRFLSRTVSGIFDLMDTLYDAEMNLPDHLDMTTCRKLTRELMNSVEFEEADRHLLPLIDMIRKWHKEYDGRARKFIFEPILHQTKLYNLLELASIIVPKATRDRIFAIQTRHNVAYIFKNAVVVTEILASFYTRKVLSEDEFVEYDTKISEFVNMYHDSLKESDRYFYWLGPYKESLDMLLVCFWMCNSMLAFEGQKTFYALEHIKDPDVINNLMTFWKYFPPKHIQGSMKNAFNRKLTRWLYKLGKHVDSDRVAEVLKSNPVKASGAIPKIFTLHEALKQKSIRKILDISSGCTDEVVFYSENIPQYHEAFSMVDELVDETIAMEMLENIKNLPKPRTPNTGVIISALVSEILKFVGNMRQICESENYGKEVVDFLKSIFSQLRSIIDGLKPYSTGNTGVAKISLFFKRYPNTRNCMGFYDLLMKSAQPQGRLGNLSDITQLLTNVMVSTDNCTIAIYASVCLTDFWSKDVQAAMELKRKMILRDLMTCNYNHFKSLHCSHFEKTRGHGARFRQLLNFHFSCHLSVAFFGSLRPLDQFKYFFTALQEVLSIDPRPPSRSTYSISNQYRLLTREFFKRETTRNAIHSKQFHDIHEVLPLYFAPGRRRISARVSNAIKDEKMKKKLIENPKEMANFLINLPRA